MQVLLWLG